MVASTQLNTDIGINALIRIYTGSPPASVATAATGTLLDTLVGNATAFGAASAGALTANGTTTAAAASGANPIGPVNAVAAGIAGYYRIVKADAVTEVLQGSAGQAVVLNTSALRIEREKRSFLKKSGVPPTPAPADTTQR